MQPITFKREISFDNVIQSGTILVGILTAVWWASTQFTSFNDRLEVHNEKIAEINIGLDKAVTQINANALVVGSLANRMDNVADALRDIRQTVDKQNDRMNGFQTELGRVARNEHDTQKIQ